jgi:hypothetical protein
VAELPDSMKIAIAADHAGYPLNEQVIAELRAAGHELIDLELMTAPFQTIIRTTPGKLERQFRMALPRSEC